MSQPWNLGRACAVCGAHTLRPVEKAITVKQRTKFGVLWLLATILTGGLALVLYLVWPRKSRVVGVDRYLECGACRSRQA